MTEDAISKGMQELGWTELAPFDTSILEFHADLREMCAMNTCGRYGASWSCPPAVGSFDELVQRCTSYSSGLLLSAVYPLSDSLDFEGMMEAGDSFCKSLQVAEAWLSSYFEASPHILSAEGQASVRKPYQLYGTGSCNNCSSCTYPHSPCRYPDRLFTPLEACGIFVSGLAKEVGLSYNSGPNTVTYFGMILHN